MTPALLKTPNFLRLWLADALAAVGDQFSVLAFPWLVLHLTGSAFAMGLVLALENVPRALFMLFGGVVTDRFSPRGVLIVTSLFRMVLVGSLAVLALTQAVELWMVYVIAFLLGTGDAFYYPAANALAPRVLDATQLQAGNSLLQGTIQAGAVFGPALAGALIGGFGGDDPLTGLGVAFAVNAVTFLLAAVALRGISVHHISGMVAGTFVAIREGFGVVWRDTGLRTVFLVIAAMAVFTTPPVQVGLPVLVLERLPQGAGGLGLLLAAAGVGGLLGAVLAGVLPKPSGRRFGPVLLGVVALSGLGLSAIGVLTDATLLAAALFVAGLLDSFVEIHFTTWLQTRTPPQFLGRVMSLLAFASVGLAPLADPVMGAVIEWNLSAALVGAGVALALIALIAAATPAARAMGLPLPRPLSPRKLP